MADNVERNRILVAVDGSEQALEAVKYVGAVFPKERTEVVLFNVSSPFSQIFSELESNPFYQSKTPQLKRWMAEEQSGIGKVMERATRVLHESGFPETAVKTHCKPKSLGIARDIVKESYNDYQAVVVGRTGLSRMRDILLKSVAIKLVGYIKHIPVIVVGGVPVSKRLLVAFDGSQGAMKGVGWVGHLLGGSSCEIVIYSLVSKNGKFWLGKREYFLPTNVADPVAHAREQLEPIMDQAIDRLLEAGVPASQIGSNVVSVDSDRGAFIAEKAAACGFGSVVVGRRGLVSFFEEVFVGRVSSTVLKESDQTAVWVL